MQILPLSVKVVVAHLFTDISTITQQLQNRYAYFILSCLVCLSGYSICHKYSLLKICQVQVVKHTYMWSSNSENC